MPEFLAAGVYVEETSFRATSIEGVPTSTAGFVGATRYGPVDDPVLVTSLAEYERSFDPFGVAPHLDHGDDGEAPNFLWHAARAFFDEGGKRLHVARVFSRLDGTLPEPVDDAAGWGERPAGAPWDDGHARVDPGRTGALVIRARHPGAAGNLVVRLSLAAAVRAPQPFDLVWLQAQPKALAGEALHGLHIARKSTSQPAWEFDPADATAAATFAALIGAAGFDLAACDDRVGATCVVTLSLTALASDGRREIARWDGLPLDPRHGGERGDDSLLAVFSAGDAAAAASVRPPLVVAADPTRVAHAFQMLLALFRAGHEHPLAGGNDGARPRADDFAGASDPASGRRLGLAQLDDIDDVAIVAAPGSSWSAIAADDQPQAIAALLVAHAERLRYRFAVLDSGLGAEVAELRGLRARLASSHAALYAPWVEVRNPLDGLALLLPPSGFVAGIYARSDAERGVHHAPANEVVRSAVGLARSFSRLDEDALGPEGIDTVRILPGRGIRVWGARTTSDDPEWKYVNVRRYLAYLERSVDVGTAWAVFEPNGEALWARIRRTVADFLLNEWQRGALLGTKPEAAFFVRCDRTTMTQSDVDSGRLVALVGVAPLKPAEFVIFRIGQWTAERIEP